MEPATVERLLSLNFQFYQTFGANFSATRQRIQPGIRHVLLQVEANMRILDLGCGNGELARELSRRGHRGLYIGLDFSPPLLEEAGFGNLLYPARFFQVNLADPGWDDELMTRIAEPFDVAFAFAVLHHIPDANLRLRVTNKVHGLLRNGGQFIHSNWQFLNSERLKTRIQPWESAGLSNSDVDQGDYLLDWRHGGVGLRYVHHFSEEELEELAETGGFKVTGSFHSDGEGGKLGLYQVWTKK